MAGTTRIRFRSWCSGLGVGALTAALLVVGAEKAAATAGPTTVVSLDDAGDPVAGAHQPTISGDGNVVVFQAGGHLWARDRIAGTTEQVDVLPGGTGGMNGAYDVNDNGRYVVFDAVWYDGEECTPPSPERGANAPQARAGELLAAAVSDPFLCTAVLRRDLLTDTTVLVSTSNDESTRGNGASQWPTISADGTRVAFDSTATDLTDQAAHPGGSVYVRDVAAETTELISVNNLGQPLDGYSQASRISANGQVIVFGTAATNVLPPGDAEDGVNMVIRRLEEGTTFYVDHQLQGWVPVAIDGDGSTAAVVTTQWGVDWEDTDHTLFIIDLVGGEGRVSIEPGQPNNLQSLHLSDDGRFVGGVAVLDLDYALTRVFDLEEERNDWESSRADAFPVSAGPTGGRTVSDDGRFVVFSSTIEDVTPDDTDGASDVFVHDRATPTQSASGVGSATTDGGSGATIADPMVVGVSGAPGDVVIDELPPQPDSTIGYALLGQQVYVTADPPTPPNFLTLTFDVDATAVPSGGDPSAVDVLREGVAITDCTSALDPGPCVASRTVLPSGDWRFVAHSPQASTWAVATPIGAGPPDPDTTAPAVDLRTPPEGAVYDVGETVTVDYDCTDSGGVGILSCAGDEPDGAALDTSTPGASQFTVTATDNAGNDTSIVHSYTVEQVGDTEPPTITLTRPAEGALYTLDSVVKAGYACADTGGSGLATCVGTRANGANLPTGSIGNRTFSVTATDEAGNSTTRTVGYRIVWPLAAFLGPVDNPPVVNTVKAGRTVPVRFSLGGFRGSSVFATGYPKVATTTCPGGAATDEIESTLGGHPPALSYSQGTYTYAFRTQSSWASRTTCRVLTVRWADGQQRSAIFRLR